MAHPTDIAYDHDSKTFYAVTTSHVSRSVVVLTYSHVSNEKSRLDIIDAFSHIEEQNDSGRVYERELTGLHSIAIYNRHIYVADIDHFKIICFTTQRKFVKEWSIPEKLLSYANEGIVLKAHEGFLHICLPNSYTKFNITEIQYEGKLHFKFSNPALSKHFEKRAAIHPAEKIMGIVMTEKCMYRTISYYEDNTQCTIYSFQICSVDGKPISEVIGSFLRPRGIAVDNSGCVYVADSGHNRIIKFSNNIYVCSTAKVFPPLLRSPHGIVIVNDYVYVCDHGQDRIAVFNLELQMLHYSGDADNDIIRYPIGIAYDGNTEKFFIVGDPERLLITFRHHPKRRGKEIEVHDRIRERLGDRYLSRLRDIAIDNNYVYVTEIDDNKIIYFTNKFEYIGDYEFDHPTILQVCKGKLYVPRYGSITTLSVGEMRGGDLSHHDEPPIPAERQKTQAVDTPDIIEIRQGPQNISIFWESKHLTIPSPSKFIVQGYVKESEGWTEIQETDDATKYDVTFVVDSDRQYTSVRVGAVYRESRISFGSPHSLRTFKEDEVCPVIYIHEINDTSVTLYTKRPVFAKDESNTTTLECKDSDNADFHQVEGMKCDRLDYHQKFQLKLKPNATPVLRATYEYCNGDRTEIQENIEKKRNEVILNSILNDKPTFKLKMANVVFVGPPRGGKSSLLYSILGLDPPEASTAVVEYTHATMNEGCIKTILATLEKNKFKMLSTKEKTNKRTDLIILLNYIHAAQMQSKQRDHKGDRGEQAGELNHESSHRSPKVKEHSVDKSPTPEEKMDGSPDTSVESYTEQSNASVGSEEDPDSTQHSLQIIHEKHSKDVFDPKNALITLIEEGVMNRIFAEQEIELFVHLFDTGGQPELLELLPHVLSARDAIIVICFKDSEPLDERYLVKYAPEDKHKHCLTTLSQLTTEETIFQCIFSAELLSGSKFTTDKNAVFVATHIDQVKGLSRNQKEFEKNIVTLDLLPRVGAANVIKQKFFSVCTERKLQLLLASLYVEDKKEVLINDLFTRSQVECIGKMDPSLMEVVVQGDSFEYVGDDERRRVELQPVMDILKQHKNKKVKDLFDYSGVSKVNDVLCKMIDKTEESVDISLRDYLLYLALVHKPEHKESDANIEPIVTLFECTEIAEALHCIPSHITSLNEKMKAVKASLRRLESDLHLIKYSCSPTNAEGEVDAIDLIICDPNALYKKISNMVCKCYLDPNDKNELRRTGIVTEMMLKDTFDGTIHGIERAQKHRKIIKDHDSADKTLWKFLRDQRIIFFYESTGLIRVPSALRAYPTEIIPMGRNVIVPSLLLVPKGKCLPLGILTALMTCGEEWKYGNDNVKWRLFTEEVFRNKVKYLVDDCIYIILVARSTCIEVRVEEQEASQPLCDTLVFVKIHESLKNELKRIVGAAVEFSHRLFCHEHMAPLAEHTGNDGFSCKHSSPHAGSIKNCSLWFSKQERSTEELKSILSSPVYSSPSGINNDTKPDGETVKLYFAENDDTKSNDEETKTHFRKMKWFKIGLLLLKGKKYDALEDHFEKLFQENPDTDFSSEVIKMWFNAEDASWDYLYRNIEFVYPDIAEKIKAEHGIKEKHQEKVKDDHGTEERCHKEVEGDPNKAAMEHHLAHFPPSTCLKCQNLPIPPDKPQVIDSVAPLGVDDLFTVCTAVHDVVNWKKLGLALGLRPVTLERIAVDESRRVEDCLREMLLAWLRCQDNSRVAEWRELLRALKECGYTTVALQVARSTCH